ncbi:MULTISPECIES: hypothetical protein [unclassified Janthinobacterium]|uniref:hypothetical protein n=1 Tax=unclassified Janthinobacterium TaxID=2610881 RepID=UPI001E59F179|nr:MULTISPECIES: hypothetical protein [unclassified Janthinobacterium]MCC7645749.1 hypothetical protein [Janthinobacterium sp. EB271-G4-3-1]MCC7694494.1 hypothetical protein [Janthinobacterium sp. EB271-G4-3-2]
MQPLNTVQAASRRQVQEIFLKENMAVGGEWRKVKDCCSMDIIIGLAHPDGNVAVTRWQCAAGKIAEILRVRHPAAPEARYHGRLAVSAGGELPAAHTVA